MSREFLRLGLRILDEQLVDEEGGRCGRVEDLELDGELGAPTRVSSILCGAAAWKRRLPTAIAQLIPEDPAGLRRVSWTHVKEISNEILLDLVQSEFEASSAGRPGGLALSQLLGAPLVDQLGRAQSLVRDVVASRHSGGDDNRPLQLEGLLIGRKAVLQRLGFQSELGAQMADGERPENFLLWSQLRGFDERGRIVVA